MVSVGRAEIDIDAEVDTNNLNRAGRRAGDQFGDGFQRESDSRLKSFGKGFGIALGALGAAAAVAGARAGVAFIGDSITAASDLEESVNAVTVSYGENAEAVLALGETSAEQFGLSAAELNSFSVQFSAFANQLQGNGQTSAEVFESIAGRATDFASVMNLEVSEAAQIFQSGLAGETEPLRKFGIDLSAAAVEAFAFENGIAEAGETLTEQQKVQARYGSLLEQTNKVQGDFTNTSDGLANQQRILSANWQNLQADVGKAFLPVMARAAQFLNQEALPAIRDLGDFIERRVIPAFRSFGDTASANSGRFSELLTTVRGFATTLQSTFTTVVESVSALWEEFGEDILRALTRTLNNVVKFLRGVFQIIEGLFQIVTGVLTGDWDKAWEGIKNVVRGAARVIRALIDQLFNALGLAFEVGRRVLGRIFGAIWDGIKDLARSGARGLIDIIQGIPGQISRLRRFFLDAGKDLITAMFNGLRDTAAAGAGFVGDIAAGIGRAIVGKINDAIRAINDAIPDSLGPVNIPNNPIAQIPNFQRGVSNFRGGLALVGEDGPEFVNLPRGTDVLPNAQTRALADRLTGGIVVNNVFTGPTTSGGRLRELEWTLRYATQARPETMGGVPA